ncbi:patatin-like phospholipase family protein [Rhodobacter calidifons]|uniref:Patatin-like phospholipase family protein n=1 Tax=Rhodobacter calidifons TaxID=2715277 RepID=A0ABX0G825_9RHOB|nr:patatin-like phospholipase family protein [Rhodobacter calidifons]NHB77299.1 patatin-like phospholipase family protein [Rhodobacter calidifons]
MRRVNLALQGGGAHGAFTWGVLDRLLEEDDLEIAGISGTSAGALNGAALKSGLISGGRGAARKRLDRLWTQVGEIGDFRMLPWIAPFLPAIRFWQTTTAALLPFSPQAIAAQLYSPYVMGSRWTNPLEPVVRDLDFTQVCAAEGPRLFVSATNVRTGKIKVFQGQDIGPEALLASACLPTVFQAVEIGGEAYWDGGYTGNPALFPLYEPDLPDDILVVSINPMRRDQVPDTPLEIQNRINEISFNASLLGELRAINFVRRLIAEGRMERGRMKAVNVQLISDEGLMNSLTADSKLAPTPLLLSRLKAAGRAAAERFLTGGGAKPGLEGTDLKGLLG